MSNAKLRRCPTTTAGCIVQYSFSLQRWTITMYNMFSFPICWLYWLRRYSVSEYLLDVVWYAPTSCIIPNRTFRYAYCTMSWSVVNNHSLFDVWLSLVTDEWKTDGQTMEVREKVVQFRNCLETIF